VLLKAGAEVNAKSDGYGATSLHLAAQSNENPEVISVLLKAGAEVNAKNNDYGFTPLQFAARLNENPEVISVLLKAGADPNLRNIDGRSALDYARKNESLQGSDALKALEEATSQ
jgi:ankyrin repeat protein